jgi:hypothetical protein
MLEVMLDRERDVLLGREIARMLDYALSALQQPRLSRPCLLTFIAMIVA